jgi:hypothetical protein
MVDDAIRSLHSLFFTSLLVLLLWLLAWPAATEKIRLYHATAEVTAWAAMREALAGLQRSVFSADADADITEDEMLGEPKPPSNEPEDVKLPLVAIITWPEERTEGFTLVRAEQFNPHVMTLQGTVARVYRIVTQHGDLPFHNYYAVFVRDTVPTVENGDVVDKPRTRIGIVASTFPQFRTIRNAGTRQADHALQRANFPDRWGEVRLALRRLGYSGAPEELSSNDPALARLQSEADPRLRSGGVTIFGAQLSLAQFFSAVGLLLAGVAFSMIGPLIALRSAGSRAHGQSWVFVVPGSARGGRRLLHWVATVITAVWAMSPLLILFLQWQSAADLQGLTTGWLFSLGALGLVFSTIVYAIVVIELRRVRTDVPKSPPGAIPTFQSGSQ